MTAYFCVQETILNFGFANYFTGSEIDCSAKPEKNKLNYKTKHVTHKFLFNSYHNVWSRFFFLFFNIQNARCAQFSSMHGVMKSRGSKSIGPICPSNTKFVQETLVAQNKC